MPLEIVSVFGLKKSSFTETVFVLAPRDAGTAWRAAAAATTMMPASAFLT